MDEWCDNAAHVFEIKIEDTRDKTIDSTFIEDEFHSNEAIYIYKLTITVELGL